MFLRNPIQNCKSWMGNETRRTNKKTARQSENTKEGKIQNDTIE